MHIEKFLVWLLLLLSFAAILTTVLVIVDHLRFFSSHKKKKKKPKPVPEKASPVGYLYVQPLIPRDSNRLPGTAIRDYLYCLQALSAWYGTHKEGHADPEEVIIRYDGHEIKLKDMKRAYEITNKR